MIALSNAIFCHGQLVMAELSIFYFVWRRTVKSGVQLYFVLILEMTGKFSETQTNAETLMKRSSEAMVSCLLGVSSLSIMGSFTGDQSETFDTSLGTALKALLLGQGDGSALANNLRSIPRTHSLSGKRELTSSSCPLTSTHTPWEALANYPPHTLNK